MSRPSKPKASKPAAAAPAVAQAQADAVAEAVLSAVHEAVGAAQTESTLGDGDATGAAQEAPSATAAPSAPAPDVVNDEKRGPEGWTVRVKGPAKGRWRAGRKFGPEEVAIPASELTEAEMEKLAADPELTVAVTEDAA